MRTMLVYAGIDEAGYGPLMGPLCVACSSWEIDGSHCPESPPDLWKSLCRAVCKKARDRTGRVAIADSKKLKGTGARGTHPMREIERGVLSLLMISEPDAPLPKTDGELLAHLGADGLDSRAPWYSGAFAIPYACEEPRVLVGRAMIAKSCGATQVHGHRLDCAAVDAQEINSAAHSGAVKSSVPWGLLMGHVRRLKSQHHDTPMRIAVDRQGGRMRYREDLMREFDSARLTILREDAEESAYRIEGIGASMVLSFTVAGETHHLPIALASMTAKYVRELWMARLNRWFALEVAGLAPTAGYVKDGRRFVETVRGALAQRNLPEAMLVRAI